jgi:hypothetical protein
VNVRRFAREGLGFGVLLWLLGFVLGMVFFPFVEPKYLGIPILAILLPATAGVSYWRLRKPRLSPDLVLVVATTWLLIALLFDFLFIVTLFGTTNYYDLDLAVYYVGTFLLPLLVGLAPRARDPNALVPR